MISGTTERCYAIVALEGVRGAKGIPLVVPFARPIVVWTCDEAGDPCPFWINETTNTLVGERHQRLIGFTSESELTATMKRLKLECQRTWEEANADDRP